MGRIKLRTMTKPDGTCEPCDIFLRLPNWRFMVDADRILDAVKRTLPGASVVPWERASKRLKRDGRAPAAKKGVAAALVAYAGQMRRGTWEDVSEVRAQIGAKAHGTWFRVQADPGVLADLTALDARIEPAIGRRAARLVRS
jgi:hypothetical protein